MDIKLLLSNPDAVKQSQLVRTGKKDFDVDHIVISYQKRNTLLFEYEKKRKLRNIVNKEIGKRKKNKEVEENTPVNNDLIEQIDGQESIEKLKFGDLMQLAQQINQFLPEKENEIKKLKENIEQRLINIGNIVHDSVPISLDEKDNQVVSTFGECNPKEGLMHPDMMSHLGMDTSDRATKVAGNRGYYLRGDMFLLQQALIHYAQQFLIKKEYDPIYTPVFMNQNMMNKVAQLSDYDEALYNIKADETTKNESKKYLIATSEQPICSYYDRTYLHPNELPIRHAGYSTCFRKEAGSSGKDTLGIFRVHQFEKIEQFCITSPHNGESWKMLEEILKTSEEFYQSLGIEYRVINIVSGSLNSAATKKYDLEAWFPISQSFKELVSCSNCTDYQSRNIECLMGAPVNTGEEKIKNYVHMLNATLCAVTRTMCCICETHQTENGVKVPDVLVGYMGKDFMKKK